MDEELMDRQQKLFDLVRGDKRVLEIFSKLDDGYGTYAEVKKLAEIIGDDMAEMLLNEYSPEMLHALAETAHMIISEGAISAQTNLNYAAGIGIKPLSTKYPRSKFNELAERIANYSLEEGDPLKAILPNALPTMAITMVDDIVRYNMDFQADAGLKPIIVRTWSGRYPSHDTKHTDWCHDLAGTYQYGEEPKNVYARHEGCRCTVEYFPSAKAKGRITALSKGEVDVNADLWNTRPETLDKRIARAQRKK